MASIPRNFEKGYSGKLVHQAWQEIDAMKLQSPESVNIILLDRRQQILGAVSARLLEMLSNDEWSNTNYSEKTKAALLKIKIDGILSNDASNVAELAGGGLTEISEVGLVAGVLEREVSARREHNKDKARFMREKARAAGKTLGRPAKELEGFDELAEQYRQGLVTSRVAGAQLGLTHAAFQRRVAKQDQERASEGGEEETVESAT
ncbi:hypothetical protein FWF74_01365 [Candidatus Saccharibacteria bacterium]|nr:hypothetical protein [Candidatus Saccharibacteria bacterium]MCL1963127.1 hypothetical protein [Candidatus Saccharibacteria bacterium]